MKNYKVDPQAISVSALDHRLKNEEERRKAKGVWTFDYQVD